MKAKTKKSNTKPKSIFHEIDQLQACILSDQNKLTKIYEKVTGNSKKSILKLDTQLGKLKQKVAKMKQGKGKKASDADLKSIVTLQKELDLLKTENASLTSGYKKFVAQQKTIQLFEKEWVKKSQVKKPIAKKKKVATQVSKKTEANSPNLVENENMEDVVIF